MLSLLSTSTMPYLLLRPTGSMLITQHPTGKLRIKNVSHGASKGIWQTLRRTSRSYIMCIPGLEPGVIMSICSTTGPGFRLPCTYNIFVNKIYFSARPFGLTWSYLTFSLTYPRMSFMHRSHPTLVAASSSAVPPFRR